MRRSYPRADSHGFVRDAALGQRMAKQKDYQSLEARDPRSHEHSTKEAATTSFKFKDLPVNDSTESENDTFEQVVINPFKREGMLQDLPVLIGNDFKTMKRFDAIPDTGATLNIISYKALFELDRSAIPNMTWADENDDSVEVADGSFITSVGQATIICAFLESPETVMEVVFHVCSKFADNIQILFGKPFLEATQTLTAFSNRLIARAPVLGRTRRLMRMYSSAPTSGSQMRILMGSMSALAYPDTGSEIDLVSTSYARKTNLMVVDLDKNDPSIVRIADGTLLTLSGKIELLVSIPKEEKRKPMADGDVQMLETGTHDPLSADDWMAVDDSEYEEDYDSKISPMRTFYVLDNLACDILLGQPFLYSVDAFKTHKHAFVNEEVVGPRKTLNGIFVLTEAQARWVEFWSKYNRGSRKQSRVPSKPKPHNVRSQGSPNKDADTTGELEKRLNQVDQAFIKLRRDLDTQIARARSSTSSASNPASPLDNPTAVSLEKEKEDLEQSYARDITKIREDFEGAMAAGLAQSRPAQTTHQITAAGLCQSQKTPAPSIFSRLFYSF